MKKYLYSVVLCLLSTRGIAMDCDEYQHQLDLISAERQQNSELAHQQNHTCNSQIYSSGFNPDGSYLPEAQKEMDKCNKAAKRSYDYAWKVYYKRIKVLDKQHPETAHCKSE